MNSEAPELKVIFLGESLPAKPKVRIWHWIAFYVYNLARKPKVWKLKREQDRIYKSIASALENEVYPAFSKIQSICPQCRNALGTLKGQVYISMIRMILNNMRCLDHPEPYNSFLCIHADKFNRNERLAAEINGFVK
jgi:hypothetical protein